MRRGNFGSTSMTGSGLARELELPLGDASAGEVAQRRLHHLAQVGGVDSISVLRLSRAFRSLAEIYSASELELARVVGPVAAARIRWFLDAPLAMAAVSVRRS